jgi:hypothetical protein
MFGLNPLIVYLRPAIPLGVGRKGFVDGANDDVFWRLG